MKCIKCGRYPFCNKIQDSQQEACRDFIKRTLNEIKVELKDIVKLQHIYIDIFSEEDEDYPDHRVINNKERAVQRILERITNKKFNQIEIWKVIQLKS